VTSTPQLLKSTRPKIYFGMSSSNLTRVFGTGYCPRQKNVATFYSMSHVKYAKSLGNRFNTVWVQQSKNTNKVMMLKKGGFSSIKNLREKRQNIKYQGSL
jgi:hypothetical protein